MSDYPGRITSTVPRILDEIGWTVADLARQLETSWGQANRLARGEIPGPETLRRLCSIFKRQPGDLLRFEK